MKPEHHLETREELAALADPVRLLTVRLLVTREATLTQLAQYLGISPSALHYHLKKLQGAGLIEVTRHDDTGKHYRATAMIVNVNPDMRFTEHADHSALPPEPQQAATEQRRTGAQLHLTDPQYHAFWQDLLALHERYAARQDPDAPLRATESVALTLPVPPIPEES